MSAEHRTQLQERKEEREALAMEAILKSSEKSKTKNPNITKAKINEVLRKGKKEMKKAARQMRTDCKGQPVGEEGLEQYVLKEKKNVIWPKRLKRLLQKMTNGVTLRM